MQCEIILIRGNSGSGKTTLANALKYVLNDAMVLSQDVVRKTMLDEPDHRGNKSVALIQWNIEWAMHNVHYLIIEGILKRSVYAELLGQLHATPNIRMCTYYFNLPFAETVQRNRERHNGITQAQLRKWWCADDQLGFETAEFTADDELTDQVGQVLYDLSSLSK